ncbi:hypothetical protein NMQ14_17660 [Methyloversatilis sp. XJ19-13]|uniref:hypothetical protein n=1 Tax=Methyloversatilis sp. XJ19-13 TaxID=2963430 RepID=UPI00211C65F6|nr:hypothetical protein [Methyloversatilis sp. XJ19-13]MCQ9376078.1 hypothetical protein [Methyloversatilis sp. XJ19-13]
MSKKWIQAVGTFNRADNSGQLVAVQPALEVNVPTERRESVLKISVETEGGQRLAEIPVTPEFGSCDDVVDEGTFQAFFELPEGAKVLRLMHADRELASFSTPPPRPPAEAAEAFGIGPRSGHSVPLMQAGPVDPNATYTLQAREKGSSLWQTLDVGLDRPDAGKVDINQFPDAAAIEVRVLKSSGFETNEVNSTEIDLSE